MVQSEQEILGGLGLKHAIEDTLLALHDIEEISRARRRSISLGLASYFDAGLKGKEAAAKKSLLLAPSESVAARRYSQFERLFELKSRSDIDTDLKDVVGVLRSLAEGLEVTPNNRTYTEEVLKLLLAVLQRPAVTGRPKEPERFTSRR